MKLRRIWEFWKESFIEHLSDEGIELSEKAKENLHYGVCIDVELEIDTETGTVEIIGFPRYQR